MKKVIFFGDTPITNGMVLDGLEPIRENVIHATSIGSLEDVLNDLGEQPKILIMDMREDRAYAEVLAEVTGGVRHRHGFTQAHPVIMISTFGTFTSGLGVVGTVTSLESYPDSYVKTTSSKSQPSSFLCRVLKNSMADDIVLDENKFKEIKKSLIVVRAERHRHRHNNL